MQTNPVSGKACSPTKGGLFAINTRITKYRVCNLHISIYIRDSALSHYFPRREVSSREWFICLYTPTLLISQSIEFVICISIYIRDSAPSQKNL